MAMDTVHLVNEHGALQLNTETDGKDRVIVKTFLTFPGTAFQLKVELAGMENIELYDEAHVAVPGL